LPSGSATVMGLIELGVADGGKEVVMIKWTVFPISAMAYERRVFGLVEEVG
jgi:hypothetical protein